MPEYKIEMPDEKLIKCIRLINLKADGKIAKRELKDAAMKAGLIHVDKERITTKKSTTAKLEICYRESWDPSHHYSNR